MCSLSSNVELPELPDARIEMRNAMRFTPSAAQDQSSAAASQWMMANCCGQVNYKSQNHRFRYASFERKDGVDCDFPSYLLRKQVQDRQPLRSDFNRLHFS